MKALSVRQPWALEINDGLKTLEFRTWKTEHRGPLLICASSHDSGLWIDAEDNGKTFPVPLPTGCMMCVVNLVHIRASTAADAEEYGFDHAPTLLAWELEGAYAVMPKPIKGKLHLFDVPDQDIVRLAEGDDWVNYDYPNRHKKPPRNLALIDEPPEAP